MDIKPCPRCGCKNIVYYNCIGRMKCKKCGRKGPQIGSKIGAIRAWNEMEG